MMIHGNNWGCKWAMLGSGEPEFGTYVARKLSPINSKSKAEPDQSTALLINKMAKYLNQDRRKAKSLHCLL